MENCINYIWLSMISHKDGFEKVAGSFLSSGTHIQNKEYSK